MNDLDIKKLAKAMGIDPMLFGPLWGNPIFDPRKDANHDYAVKEWMWQQSPSQQRRSFIAICQSITLRDYQIGDYARAALKVLP